MRKTSFNYTILLILGISLLWGCQSHQKLEPVQGVLDVSNPTVFEEGRYTLDGEWEFYWNELLTPETITQAQNKAYLTVYGSWTAFQQANGENYPAYGYATYRLKVLVPRDAHNLGLYVPKIWSASKVWVNGEVLSEMGKVAENYEDFENKIVEKLVPFEVADGMVDIIVQVANHEHFLAGVVKSFELGDYQAIFQKEAITSSGQLMWLGCLLIMGMYHFILFLFRKERLSTLFFGAICICISLRLIVFGDHELYIYLKHHWGVLNYYFQSRIYYITTMALGPLGLAYIYSLYPAEGKFEKTFLKRINSQVIIKYSTIFSVLLSIVALCTPSRMLAMFIPIGMPIALGFPLLFFVVILIRAMLRKRPEIVYQMAGIGAMVIAGINDGLHTIGVFIFSEGELLPLGFAIFLCLQFVVLSKRFSNAFKAVEDLSANLERKVEERTAEVTHQKEELQVQRDAIFDQKKKLEGLLSNINDSIRYGSRIQRAILGSAEQIELDIKQQNPQQEAFIFFKPREIVSGDFYWYDVIKGVRGEEYQILIIADCTGHGVPGAFMTVMGTDFITGIINESKILQPCKILEDLDRKVRAVLHKQKDSSTNDGMDMSIIVFDKSNYTLAYAGAKNPLYWARRSDKNQTEMLVIKGDKYPIGGHADAEKNFKTHKIDVIPGDIFYLFTDGYQDQFGGPENRKYLRKRFRELLWRLKDLPAHEQRDSLEKEFEAWKGTQQQTDDVLVAGFAFQK
ncbi:MAG: PP2C family protein-serine/threonine phosphatase [Flammeovirgaceae bacterium]